MTEGPRDPAATPPLTSQERQRAAFGERVRALREAAGLTQVELAQRVGRAQSRISEMEGGRTMPDRETLERIATALQLSPAVRTEVTDLLAQLQVELQTWRVLAHRGHGWNQHRIAQVERSASVVRYYQPTVVPGLLQTSAYARAMLAAYDPSLLGIDDLVEGRLRRQEVLADTSKSFHFLIAESVLHSGRVPPRVLREQLDRILLLAAMQRIDIGVVPVGLQDLTMSGFAAFDDTLVAVELDTTEVRIKDPEGVARYLELFERLRAEAVRGAELAALVRRVDEALVQQTGDE